MTVNEQGVRVPVREDFVQAHVSQRMQAGSAIGAGMQAAETDPSEADAVEADEGAAASGAQANGLRRFPNHPKSSLL